MSAIFPSKMTLRPQFVWNESFWQPNSLGSSLALWLDAADASTITLNGSTVSQWNDKSGNAYHVSRSVSAEQPAYGTRTLNGLNVLDFDGVNDDLRRTGMSHNYSDTLSIFMVFQLDSSTQDFSNVFGVEKVGGSLINITQAAPLNDQIYTASSAKRLDTDFLPCVYSLYHTATSNHAYLNGTFGYENTGVAFGTNTITKIVIGERLDLINARCAKEAMAEIILVEDDATDATRQKVEGYLAWKWGLQANLPSDHPYKINPPLR